MTLVAGEVRAPGGIEGTGSVVVVDHTSDNNLVTFRYKFAAVKMEAAEEDFEVGGHHFRAGAFVIQNADRARLEPALKELGLSGWAMAAAPAVKTHDLDLPRIGYVHSWANTQNEGWVRAALDTYGVPYTYFADQKLREGNLRAKYDVIIFPHVGGTAQTQVNGLPKTGASPLPYKKTDATPNLGALDQSEDIRGGMGLDGLTELYKFVQAGGTLITEGSTASIFPEYNLTAGVTVETPTQLFARGTILRGIITDTRSPLVYGYDGGQVPVYFSQSPVLNVATGGGAVAGGFGGGGAPIPGVGQNTTPMATRLRLSPWSAGGAAAPSPSGAVPAGGAGAGAAAQAGGGAGAGAGAGGGFGGFAAQAAATERPRVVIQFPASADDMLLSGTLAGGQALAGRAQLVDAPIGSGHVVMFAIRPFWRWQTQGTYFLGFNAILNWNDLDAGKSPPAARAVGGQ
jgi:hypothetical protein